MASIVHQGISLKLINDGLEALNLTIGAVKNMGRKAFSKHLKTSGQELKKKKIDPGLLADNVCRYYFK
jgi:hypothetical protein